MNIKNKNGMTLLELMVVVIIIGGLAAVSYPAYVSSIEKARATEAAKMVATIQAAESKYETDFDGFTTKVTDLSFEPVGKGVSISDSIINTKNFRYTLEEDKVSAARTSGNTSYSIVGVYEDDFVRCVFSDEEGEKICSSLSKTKLADHDDTYKIY